MPEQDAVLAIIGGVRDMQAVLDKVWAHLLPAMRPAALPADPSSYGELCDRLARLSLPLPPGQSSSPRAEHWAGTTFTLENNDLKLASVAIEFGDDHATLIMRDERDEYPIHVGSDSWLTGTVDVRGQGNEPVAACGAWTAEDVYEVRVCFYAGVFCPVFRFSDASGVLRLDVEPNVSWDPPPAATIAGRVAD